tara:strand:- start:33580 stop:34044 length:465 start_codon:yes stop_codon:yes gene_type:complete
VRVLRYSSGYKYQLKGDFTFQTQIRGHTVTLPFIRLTREGLLTIIDGYACDGPSGPTIDTPLFILGAFVHDALYQVIRAEELPHSMWRMADQELKNVIMGKIEHLKDETTWWKKVKYRAHRTAWSTRSLWIMYGLEKFRGSAALPRNKRLILEI